MAVRRVQLRRGNTNENNNFTGAVGELTVDTQTVSVRVHDGTAGGKDLMRADMSNQSFAEGNITIAEGVGNNTLTIGAGGAENERTTVAIAGNLTVAGTTTQSNSLTIASKLITVNSNGNATALSTHSIGVIYERTQDGDGNAQNSAFIIWKEDGDYFVLGTASVDESTASDFTGEGDFSYSDLYLNNLYAQNSVDVNNNNITNVGQIELDTITFADAGTVLTINLQDALNDKALTIKDAGNTEYLTINTNAESTTLGVVAKTTTLLSNDIDIGSDAANDVVIEVVARTGDNDGSDLTIKAGSAADSNNNFGGNLILASGSGVQNSVEGVGGTSSIQFQTKVDGVAGVAERMRIHTDGSVGIGTATPSSLLHISGADTSTITLENTKDDTFGQDDDPSTIVFKGNGQANALAEIVGAHDTALDNDKGVLIFKTGDGGTSEALRLASDLKATFAGAVEIATSLDLTDGNISNVGTIDLDKITDRANNGIEIEIQNGVAAGLVIDDTDGNNFLTLNADADTITLHQATSLSSTLTVNASTTILAASGGDAELFLIADNSEDGGDVWRVQAPNASRTLTFAGENDASDGYVDVLTLTGANTSAASSATVKGTLIVEGEIQSATDIVFQVDNDDNGNNNKFAFQRGDGTEVASLDEAGKLTITGVSDLDGGIDVNDSKLTVANTGATVIKSTLGVYGNLTLDDVDNNTAPNLLIKATDDSTKFEVKGASGNTTVGGTLGVTGLTTLSSALQIVQGVANGILFNSDRDAEADQDAAIITVKDSAGGTNGTVSWDDALNTFSFGGSKLNSVLDITVGALGSTTTTISASTGAISTAGSDAYLTLKNTTNEFGAGQAETQIQFQDHEGKNLATIRGSHATGDNDSKGQLLFYTNTGAQANEGTLALTISNAQLATFAGNATVSGGTINVGGGGASIVATNANLLTITEDTVAFSDAVTVGTNLTVGGNIVGDADEAKIIFAASAAEASTITLGGGGTVIVGGAGKLRLGTSNIIENSAGETTVTLNANQRTTLSGDLAVVGGATGGLASTTILLGADAARDSEIKVVARTGAANDGRSLTIEAGSSAQGENDLDGGNLILKSGDGDGTGTSDIEFFTKTTSVDGTTKKMTLKGSGRLGLGEASPDSILHITDTAPSIKVLNTTQGDGDGARSSNVAFFGEASGGEEGQLAQVTASHDGDQDDFKGQLVFGVNQGNVNATTIVDVLTLASDKSATFEGAVTIKGDLDIQATGSLTTIDTTNLSVSDAVIELASNADQAVADDDVDTGIVFTRGNNVHPAVFFWDEDDDKFVLATKQGASTSTTNFSAGNAPVEAQLDVGTLNADVISIDAGSATSLAVKQGNTSYLTFDTTNTKVIANQILTAPNSSVVGSFTFGNGTIDSSTGTINFGDDTLTSTGTANFGATTVDSLDASNGGITQAGAISGITSLAGSDLDITLTDNEATSVQFAEANLGAYLTFVTTDNSEEVVFNQGGADIDFRVEGDTETHLIYARAEDGSEGVGIKNNNPQFDLDITGTLGVSGLADLNGGIDVNGSNFTVSAAGAMVAKSNSSVEGTFNVKKNNAAAFVVEKEDGTDVFNIDTSNANVANAVSTLQGTLKVDHLQSATGGNANFTIEIADNVADALTIQDATNGLDFIQIDSRDDAELITLAQATSLSETLSVTGIATFISDVKLEDSSGGIIFNSDDTGDGDEADATMLTVERGILTNAIIAWDETRDEFNINSVSGVHLVGKNGSNALTVGGAHSGAGATTFTVTTAGAVTAVGGFVDTTTLSQFASGTTVGTLTLTSGKIAAPTLDLHSNGNIVLRVDADQANTAGNHKFSFVNGDNTEIASIDEAGALAISSNLTISGTGASALDFTDADVTIGNAVATEGRIITIGGGATTITKTAGVLRVGGNKIQASDGGDTITLDASDNVGIAGNLTVSGGTETIQAASGADAQIYLVADNDEQHEDTWRVQAPNASRTLAFGNQNAAGNAYVDVLTLTGHDTGTSTTATFAGNVTISGTGTFALDFTNANTTIGNSIGNAILTLGATASTVAIPGDLKVATTKSITLNNGVVDAAADVDAYIYVDRGTDANVAIRWDEGLNRWMHTLNGTDYYNILNANDTLFTLETDSGGASAFTFEQTDGSTLTFTDGGNAQVVVTNNSGTVSLSLEDSFDVVRDLGVGRNLTVTGNIIGNGSRVSFNDPIVQIGDGNTSNVNDLGFYGEYANSGANARFAGLLYQPESTSDNGVWKLFDLHSAQIGSLDTNVTVADAELSTLDINEVRGGSKVGVGDNEAGTDLTISGGASTGNGAGGSIVFKVAEASQGAGATERLPTTTALTVNASKRVITAGDLAVGGQAVVDSSTLTLGVGADEIAVTKSFHKITPDNGNNTVATITGGETGSILILMHSGAGGTLTLSNDANNGTNNGLALDGGDITLAGKSTVTLIYTGSNWSLVSKAIVS